MKEIAWEYVDHQKHALRPIRNRRVPGMQSVAMAKMLDVDLIWTDFDEYRVALHPWVSVFIDFGNIAEVMAIYRTDFDEQLPGGIPQLCLRRAKWDKQEDKKKFSQAEDRKKYLTSENQLISQIMLLEATSCPEILQSIESLMTLYQNGIRFHRIPLSTRDNRWNQIPAEDRIVEIRCQASDERSGFSFKFEYFLYSLENKQIHNWVQMWRNLFQNLDFEAGIAPEHDVTVDWRLSLYDLLYK